MGTDAGAFVNYRLSSSNAASITACFSVDSVTAALATTYTLDFVAQPLWMVLVSAVWMPGGTLIDTARVWSLIFVQQPPYLLSPPLLNTAAVQVAALTIP